jgi:hypothetical protein
MRGSPKRFFTFFENFGLQMPEKIEGRWSNPIKPQKNPQKF